MLAYADYVTTFASESEPGSVEWAKGYKACLKDFTDEAMVKIVDEYLFRNPSEKTQGIVIAVNGAFRELCKNQLPPTPKSKC